MFGKTVIDATGCHSIMTVFVMHIEGPHYSNTSSSLPLSSFSQPDWPCASQTTPCCNFDAARFSMALSDLKRLVRSNCCSGRIPLHWQIPEQTVQALFHFCRVKP